MARLSTYTVDENLQPSDRVIGTDYANTVTKNYTLSGIANWAVSSNALAGIGDLSFRYTTASDPLLDGAFYVTNGLLAGTPLEDLTQISVSKRLITGTNVDVAVQRIFNGTVEAINIDDINASCEYVVDSVVQNPIKNDFYDVTFSSATGTGNLTTGMYLAFRPKSAGGTGSAAWGSITGTVTDQTDLINYLGLPKQLYPIKSENDSLFDIGITNNGELIVIPEGSFEPVIASPPVITGTLKVWYTLGAIAGGATGAPTPIRTWQWQRSDTGLNWVDIGSATNATYTLTSDDADKRIRVQQTETNVLGSVTSSSDLTEAITPSIFKDTEWQNITPVTWGALTVQTWN